MSFQEFQEFTPSGTTDFTLTAGEIIDDALDTIQVGSDGEGVEPEEYKRALNALNLVMRECQAQGLHIATYRTGTLFPKAGDVEYVLEDTENVDSTNTFFEALTTADVTSPATIIPVDDASNMEVGDRFLVLKNDSTFFRSFIKSITPTTSPEADIELEDATDGDIDAGCQIYNWREELEPVARVLDIYRRDFFQTDVPIQQLSRDEYERLPFKTTTSGVPSQAYYWRSIRRGTMFIWSPPVNDTYLIRFWYESRLDDMKATTDAIDLDRAYLPYLVYKLAVRMCDRLGISSEIKASVKQEMLEIEANVFSYDNEVGPLRVSLNREGQ